MARSASSQQGTSPSGRARGVARMWPLATTACERKTHAAGLGPRLHGCVGCRFRGVSGGMAPVSPLASCLITRARTHWPKGGQVEFGRSYLTSLTLCGVQGSQTRVVSGAFGHFQQGMWTDRLLRSGHLNKHVRGDHMSSKLRMSRCSACDRVLLHRTQCVIVSCAQFQPVLRKMRKAGLGESERGRRRGSGSSCPRIHIFKKCGKGRAAANVQTRVEEVWWPSQCGELEPPPPFLPTHEFFAYRRKTVGTQEHATARQKWCGRRSRTDFSRRIIPPVEG